MGKLIVRSHCLAKKQTLVLVPFKKSQCGYQIFLENTVWFQVNKGALLVVC